jgi:hypothetical protein
VLKILVFVVVQQTLEVLPHELCMRVVGTVQKGLDDALGKAMDEGKEEEGDGDPVESYSQVCE